MDEQTARLPPDDFVIERLDLVDPIRLQDVPVPQRKWLWQDWVPLGTTSALYGDGGTGKTLLAQQLMTSCAAGVPFLGMPVMKCRTIGIFCEDEPDELHRRQAAINGALSIEFSDLENVRWMSRIGTDNLLNVFAADGRSVKTPFFDQMVRAAADFGAQLVVIDTAADTFGGNENIRSHVRQFIALLTRLAIEREGAVLLLAHPSVTGRASGSGDSGSTAWSNSVRSRLYLKRQEAVNGDVPDADIRILSRLKANYAVSNVDLTLRYDQGAFALDGLPDGVDPQTYQRSHAADEAFIAGLNELEAQNFRGNVHRGQANYAPKALREKTQVCASFSEAELTGAMNRLIRGKQISSVLEGPPSRRRSCLVVVAPDLPGV